MPKHLNRIVFVILLMKSIQGQLVDRVQFQNQVLGAINGIRQNYASTRILLLNTVLSSNAQAYSDRLAAQNTGLSTTDTTQLSNCGVLLQSQYQTVSGYGVATCGQSLAFAAGSAGTTNINNVCNANAIVQIWNAERIYYNFTNPPNDSASINKVADFTQMVWYINFFELIKLNAYSNSISKCYLKEK